MGRRQGLFLMVCALSFLLSWLPAHANEAAEKETIQAADAWLILVDRGQYSESWNEAAEYFRNALRNEQWNQALNAVRTPLGKVVKRKVKSKQYATSLPGPPDGEYVVIRMRRLSKINNPQSRRLSLCWIRMASGEYQVITLNRWLIIDVLFIPRDIHSPMSYFGGKFRRIPCTARFRSSEVASVQMLPDAVPRQVSSLFSDL
jgi:Protein of unknown function (DUF4019)